MHWTALALFIALGSIPYAYLKGREDATRAVIRVLRGKYDHTVLFYMHCDED